ncbi:c-myc promoter binding protein [Holotrichia oblita]|uniref:C-myc promoter binding protein n=1 Tax=Holotrichia oblita TaxID=644536 RepID=A0ACB9TB97_HOLOL|nr:c-myc promoter binding protein [Holotrichia oblita]
MNKFADYFVICGLDYSSGLEPDRFAEDNLHSSPLERSYTGKVLAHYPENVPNNPFDASAVCMLCLPSGLRFRTQKHSVTQVPTFHSFVITREDGKRCYGFSLVFYEEVRNRDICNAMQTLQAMYVTELSSGIKMKVIQTQTPQSRSLPRHFKLSTPGPGGVLTYYDISKDRLFVSKSIGIVCQVAYVQAAKIFLENLYKCVPKRTSTPGLSLESYIFNLLYEVELPAPGKSIMIHLPPSDPKLPLVNTILQCPSAVLELPHLDFSLKLMFLWLGVDVVIQLFTCLLLENQVLLRSTDCQRLMVVAEGITSLLFPFSWPHVYVPILPASLHHFLDAPVPFVMGKFLYNIIAGMLVYFLLPGLYASIENIKVASEATLCYIDIDKCKVQLPEEIPAFPNLGGFTDELNGALDKYGVHIPNTDNCRNNQDIMSRSCTLPGRPQNRRKLSIHDTLDSDRPPSPPGSARSEALQRIADIVRRTGVALDQNEVIQPTDSYMEDLRFNNSIREIFLNRFVHMFQSYENFVIFPNQDREDWLNNRDTMQNFDKASFLSDQPDNHRLFLWRFLESQMFTTFIDNKILSIWGEIDNNLVIFDTRIKLLKQRYGGENLIRSHCYEPCTTAHDSQKLLDRRLTNPDFESPIPKELLDNLPTPSRIFPLLDVEVLNKTPVVNKGSIPRANAGKKTSYLSRSFSLSIEKAADKESNADMSPALLAQANWTFVEKLLKDCKIKTKRMLLAKLGSEGVTLSSNSGSDNSGSVEESTLVASLCDFLERVWSHGLQRKRGKSALWSHLIMYQEYHQPVKKLDNQHLSPAEISRLALRLENWSGASSIENKNMKTDLPPLPESLLFDITNVQTMSDVKTGIGMARAWIRLALEKKHLSKHLRTLLSDQNILKSLYKRAAFLRCEEEKEQFLYHLLSLNAVDYFCFTSTYPMTVINYRIVIVPTKKGTITSANVWIVLSGTVSETKKLPVPKNALNFEIKHKNLGVLTTLRIGHDNTGMSAKWMVEYVLVRNEVTGHIYNFPCGRWLGRGVDDGSTERLLVGTLLLQKVEGDESSYTGSLGKKNNIRSQSPGPPRTEIKPSQIQHMLGDCVNNIVKWHYRRSSERNTTLTALLCGDTGLVKCLELVFLLGFRSARLFVFNHYLWDYFVRVKEQFEFDLLEETSGNRSVSIERNHQETVAVWRCYCHLVDEIQFASKALGKDGKFQLFICLSVRSSIMNNTFSLQQLEELLNSTKNNKIYFKDFDLSLYTISFLLETNNEQIIIAYVNKQLKSSQDNGDVYTLLLKVLSTISSEILSENILFWMQQIATRTKTLAKAQRYLVLSKLIELGAGNQDFNKLMLSTILFQLIEECLSVDVECVYIGNVLNCLIMCLEYYASSCGSKKTNIESYLIKYLVSKTINSNTVKIAALCFQKLQKVGSPGLDSINYKNNWKVAFERLCVTLDVLYDNFFDDIDEFYRYEKLPVSAFTLEEFPKVVSATEVLYLLENRLTHICTFLKGMLENEYCCVKPIHPEYLLDIITRVLSLHVCLNKSDSETAFHFAVLLIKNQISILYLLRSLIGVLRLNILQFSTAISKLLIDSLTRTQNCNCFKHINEYKEVLYKIFDYWIGTLKNCFSPNGHEKLLILIASEIAPITTNLSLNISSGSNNTSKKNKKKAMDAKIIANSNKTVAVEDLKYPLKGKEVICYQALCSLITLFENVDVSVTQNTLTILYTTLTQAIFSLNTGRKIFPYITNKIKLKLFESVLALLEYSNIPPQSISLTINLLKTGENDEDKSVSIVCTKGLNLLEKICQPVCPSLYFTNKDNIISSRNESSNAELTATDIENGNINGQPRVTQITEKLNVTNDSLENNSFEADVDEVLVSNVELTQTLVQDQTIESEETPTLNTNDVSAATPEKIQEPVFIYSNKFDMISDVEEPIIEPAQKKLKVDTAEGVDINAMLSSFVDEVAPNIEEATTH